MDILLKNILDALRSGYLDIAYQQKQYINSLAMEIYEKPELDKNDLEDLKDILSICNITYNDTDKELLPIEDGVYDLLLEKYKKYDPNFQVGAEVINFKASEGNNSMPKAEPVPAVTFISDEDMKKINDGLYKDEILINPLDYIDARDIYRQPTPMDPSYVTKRLHDTQHNHPELVGTLDKCKFVLDKDASDREVYNDSNVKIVERDFFADHIKRGIISPNQIFDIVLELKYDGISVEADCTDEVVSARSRGDTGIGMASDLTPLLKGYKFPHRDPGSPMIGVKFEAIITQRDLPYFNRTKNYEYKNCRSAIVGLLSSSDAYKYRDYITLVPLAVEDSVFKNECMENRIIEIEFLNKYFVSKGCPLRYGVSSGTYIENLFMIKTFTSEAEYYRSWIPFMYDGIVVSYLDPEIRHKLGRENFVNKYSIAVKFNPLKKQSIFRGYTYTVGQDGSITPMIHYDPVEFYGTIHPKSSGHSYAKFQELNLHKGDIVDIEYVNDVMPYVSKPLNEYNIENAKRVPAELFPQLCPICGQPLVISDSGKSAKCVNKDCGGRSLARMVNMCAKLNMNGFGEATISKINVTHLIDLFLVLEETNDGTFNQDNYDYLSSVGFGPVEIQNMRNEVHNVLVRPLPDSELLGSLGFDNISTKTWESILARYTISDIDMLILNGWNEFNDTISTIKGIGPSTVETIYREWEYFKEDIEYMMTHGTIVHYQPLTGKKVRATGFRDKDFFAYLRSIGFNADDNGSLTKDTDILLIPYEGFTSSKTQKAQQYNTLIVPIDDFRSNPNMYM